VFGGGERRELEMEIKGNELIEFGLMVLLCVPKELFMACTHHHDAAYLTNLFFLLKWWFLKLVKPGVR